MHVFMIGDFDQAIKLFLECIALIESNNNISSQLVSPLVALGLALNKSEQYNEAVKSNCANVAVRRLYFRIPGISGHFWCRSPRC